MATITNTIRWADNTAELKQNLLQGIGTVDAMKQSVDRAAASMGGQGLFMQANKLTAAIDQLGGITKLTAAEQERATATLDKAIEKYKVMGMTAPPALVETRDRMREVGETTERSLGEFIKGLPLVEGFIAAFSVERLLEFGKALLESLSQLEELHLATGISTEDLQRLAYVGTEFGLDLPMMARGVEQLSAKLATGDGNASKAVQMLGLNIKQLIAEGPQEAFLDVAEAVGRIEDPTLKIGVATDLWGGKLAKILLPALGELRTKLNEVPKDAIVSDENVKRAHDFEVGLEHLTTRLKAYTVAVIEYIRNSEHQGPNALSNMNLYGPQPAGGQDIPLPPAAVQTTISNVDLIANRLKALRAEAIDPLTAAQKQQILELKRWGESEASIAALIGSNQIAVHLYIKTNEESAAAEKKAKEEADRFAASVRNLTTDAIGAHKGFGMFGQLMQENTQTLGDVRDQVDQLDASVNTFHDGISVSGDVLSTVTIPMFSKLPSVVAKNTAEIDKARESTVSWLDAFKKFPDIVTAALTGGGGLGGALKGFGNEITKNLFGEKGAWGGITESVSGWAGPIGKALGGMLPGLGGIVSSLVGKLFSIGGPSKQELQGRDSAKQFEDQMGGWQGIQKALLGTGMAADQVNAKIQALWAAEKQGGDAVKAQIEGINKLLGDQKQDDADLQAAIQKYGFTIDQLGPTLQKQKLGEQATGIMNDFRLLVGAGIDSNTVMEKMAGSVNQYVQDAIRMGVEVPAAMKPMLEKMADQGQLTDANGNKITDLTGAGVTFAETMSTAADRIVKGFQDLLEKIGLIPKAAQDAAAAINAIPPPPDYNPMTPGGYAATGGVVTPFGIQHFAAGGNVLSFRSRGTDTVPAMLTPGEMVLTRSQQASLFGGGGVAEIHNHIILDGKEIGRSVKRYQNGDYQMRHKVRAA